MNLFESEYFSNNNKEIGCVSAGLNDSFHDEFDDLLDDFRDGYS